MTRSRIFFYSSIFFFLGVFFTNYGSNSQRISFRVIICLFCFFIFLSIIWRKQKKVVFTLVAVVFFLGGSGRVMSNEMYASLSTMRAIHGYEVRFYGRVCKEPEKRDTKTHLVIQGIEMNQKPFSGKASLIVFRFPEVHYGDQVLVKGILTEPENFSDSFNYQAYLAKEGIYSILENPTIIEVQPASTFNIMSRIYLIKQKFESRISQLLPEPHASFLSGLLLGSRSSIPEYLKQAFQKTGLTHIIAVSGYNITIIANAVRKATLGIVSRKKASVISIGSIILFVFLTGAQASIVRAGIMGIIALLARQTGRLSNVTNSLVASALVMVFVNPLILIHDAGFQLSFLATAGLVYVAPRIEKWFACFPKTFEIRESLLLSTSAQITTLPLIITQFGNLSIIAPLANVFVLPVIPLIMFTGFITGIVGLFSQSIGSVIAFVPWILLSYEINVIELLSHVPFGFFNVK